MEVKAHRWSGPRSRLASLGRSQGRGGPQKRENSCYNRSNRWLWCCRQEPRPLAKAAEKRPQDASDALAW